MPLYTVGHGNRSLDELAGILIDDNIGLLADVRRFPGSRRHPHFSRRALEAELPARTTQVTAPSGWVKTDGRSMTSASIARCCER